MTVFPPLPDAPDPNGQRVAIYFIPDPCSDLARFGATWLGRGCATGDVIPQAPVPGLATDRVAELTASARAYGFHATLKAPFHLKPGHDLDQLRDALRNFAADRTAFEVQLALKTLGGFLALMMSPSDHRMNELAADCVRDFDGFRAPLSDADLARRRKAALSSHQESLLQRWGYPYVMDEFRFHMTLSSRLPDGAERDAMIAALEDRTRDLLTPTASIDAVALVAQETRDAPFTLVERFPFAVR